MSRRKNGGDFTPMAVLWVLAIVAVVAILGLMYAHRGDGEKDASAAATPTPAATTPKDAEPPENPCGKVFADIHEGTTLEDLEALFEKYRGYSGASKDVYDSRMDRGVTPEHQIWTMSWEDGVDSGQSGALPPIWKMHLTVYIESGKLEQAAYSHDHIVNRNIAVKSYWKK